MLRGDARPSLRDAALLVIENLLRLHQPGLTHLKLSARLSPRAFRHPAGPFDQGVPSVPVVTKVGVRVRSRPLRVIFSLLGVGLKRYRIMVRLTWAANWP